MLENWKNALNEGDSACALFMDLSKTFGNINFNLLLAKIKAYNFSEDCLTLICSYLKNRKQRVKIHNSARATKKLLEQDPHVVEIQPKMFGPSLDHPLLFNFFYKLSCLIGTIYDIRPPSTKPTLTR